MNETQDNRLRLDRQTACVTLFSMDTLVIENKDKISEVLLSDGWHQVRHYETETFIENGCFKFVDAQSFPEHWLCCRMECIQAIRMPVEEPNLAEV